MPGTGPSPRSPGPWQVAHGTVCWSPALAPPCSARTSALSGCCRSAHRRESRPANRDCSNRSRSSGTSRIRAPIGSRAPLGVCGQEPSGDVGLRNGRGLDDADRPPRRKRREVSGGSGDFGVGRGLGDGDHRRRREPVRHRSPSRTALEVGHLLDDVGRRQTREARVLGTARALRPMAEAAGVDLRPPAVSDDLGHGGVVGRVPVRGAKEIAQLGEREGCRAARDPAERSVVRRRPEVRGLHRVGPGRRDFDAPRGRRHRRQEGPEREGAPHEATDERRPGHRMARTLAQSVPRREAATAAWAPGIHHERRRLAA